MKNLIFRLVSLSSRSDISTACTRHHGRFYLHVWASGLSYRHCHQSTSQLPPLIAEQPLHKPVMLNEVLHCLDIQPGQVVLDMTFGGGGHTKEILNTYSDVTVLALDRDPVAFGLAQQLAKQYNGRLQPLLGRFSELILQQEVKPGSVDVVLLDAGCSSMQMDQAQRGFSLSRDGPLDMRMDGDRYPDTPRAADVVNALDQKSLASILLAYGEERHARKISSAVVEARSICPITRTQQLASVVAGSFPSAALYARKDKLERPSHVATKTFQALRIFVNDEMNELHAGLRAAQTLLRPGGRLCVLTFHSLEDRLVKRFLSGGDMATLDQRHPGQRLRRGAGEREGEGEEEEGEEVMGGNRTKTTSHWSPLQRGVTTPGKKELAENPRGRSAKLRAALRC
ncbi:12S rRNA N4-methylcytidine methyltransferase-like [Gadus chalcogrammus]|uniref:12S rRNA N4-methylcytidine methyltransferase-like n=1 Tax=Gadus chalcogrammus TaxID=1042646 RepID=UPI0024C47E65|nr:12S rRNA N4-methylcytidine methyltransferase-like [Gadus chalcogrammus]XP_056463632.1 12S rRNA N4-methylcytidine methyltransferase-like [Gadus chalcogrammus]